MSNGLWFKVFYWCRIYEFYLKNIVLKGVFMCYLVVIYLNEYLKMKV